MATMPTQARRPPQLDMAVFRGSDAIASGLLTPAALRGGAWRALFRDVYADAWLPPTHRLNCEAAARYLLPAGTAIAGRSAAALLGAWSLPADARVEVLVPAGSRFGRGEKFTVHATKDLPATDLMTRGGIALTTPVRTCWDLARWLPVAEAVPIIDAMAANRLVTLRGLRSTALARAGVPGWLPLLRAVSVADAGAGSPQESRLRVLLVLAGVPRPVTQYVVRLDGRFVARLDLAWPERKVGIEYDGLWHDNAGRFHRDRRRLNMLVAAGWTILHATAPMLAGEDFDALLVGVCAALGVPPP